PATTSRTRMPDALLIPSSFASCLPMGVAAPPIPRYARRTRPSRMSMPATMRAVAAGIAKQIPCAVGMIAVLMPTTLACVSTSGPPEFPGLSAASVWMTFSMSRPSRADKDRPRALTTPVVTVEWKPSGSPMAMTSCPTRRESVSASSAAGSPVPRMRMTARSVALSVPTTAAVSSAPLSNVTATCCAPSTTCALGKAQPGHDRDRHVREESGLVADLRSPGQVLPEPLARFVGDLDALLARALAEPLDRAFARRLYRVLPARRRDVRQRADDPDL